MLVRSGGGVSEERRLGSRSSLARRRAERRAIVDAHLELVVGAAIARIQSGWLSEVYSPLGMQRHIAAVRRRVDRQRWSSGPIDAAIVSGRHMLTLDAIADELFREPAGLACAVTRALFEQKRPANCNGRRCE